ncbi:hypothetical protein Smic_00280 [Streptomyces microflavus]|uniref:Uncharacterized protein n=1 Tax=Streptomyces microflavus TaxID=1919 RepID=A0A7J0CG78_STRMI|nr:hypothetical protein Smic_00280 [Streptomyces microflavus]
MADERAARLPEGAGELRGPQVLPDDEGDRHSLRHGPFQHLDVPGTQCHGRPALRRVDGHGPLRVQLDQLHRGQSATLGTADEGQIAGAYGAGGHGIGEDGHDGPGEAAAGKGDDEVFHRSDGHGRVLSASRRPRGLRGGYGHSRDCIRNRKTAHIICINLRIHPVVGHGRVAPGSIRSSIARRRRAGNATVSKGSSAHRRGQGHSTCPCCAFPVLA